MNFQFGHCRKGRNFKIAEELEVGPADWVKKLFKFKDSGARSFQAPRETIETGGSDEGKAASQKGVGLKKETISASELQKKLESGTPILILDVREKNELSGKLGHLENSINIPVGSLESRISELNDSRNREIIVVCRSGMRAERTTEILARNGFGNVKVLKGGMIAWQDLKK
ncbi:rhodanese-like domain-containing protein [Methanosarcina sp. WWM596]|uniref:rhodanese-like domain-containing protein n=1 Tax=Methanosarcina sp. WWM596 TaxID=1434103 RepID=UPI000615FC30|nr:rhodanese-like domain-containing protein [Methanosarcina sp. WWM596]AKB17793.1 molybdopterin biosynthesis protein MoeB [Methanosarcina sp. WWM596]